MFVLQWKIFIGEVGKKSYVGNTYFWDWLRQTMGIFTLLSSKNDKFVNCWNLKCPRVQYCGLLGLDLCMGNLNRYDRTRYKNATSWVHLRVQCSINQKQVHLKCQQHPKSNHLQFRLNGSRCRHFSIAGKFWREIKFILIPAWFQQSKYHNRLIWAQTGDSQNSKLRVVWNVHTFQTLKGVFCAENCVLGSIFASFDL